MRGLAIYSAVILGISFITMFIEILQGCEIAVNVWGIVLYVPIAMLIVKVIKEG